MNCSSEIIMIKKQDAKQNSMSAFQNNRINAETFLIEKKNMPMESQLKFKFWCKTTTITTTMTMMTTKTTTTTTVMGS